VNGVREGFGFRVLARDGHARRGVLETPHGSIETPVFMPVGTSAAVKALSPEEVAGTGARMVLANTYHLMLRPGADLIGRAGGLHGFMSWPHGVLTDSGGYQVFSLASRRKIDDDGVTFQSHIDGSSHRLTPESAMEIQQNLGADIAMALDECPPGDASADLVRQAMDRTTAWARRALAAHGRASQALFGIVQGGTDHGDRRAHAEELSELGFDGMAIGGLSVGEPPEVMWEVVADLSPRLPAGSPRYLMGVGREIDILKAVASGVDMFDCVLPTRNARNGQAFTSAGRLSIKQARFKEDPRPLDPSCDCYACRTFDRRYLRHLYLQDEILVHRMLTLHNLHHYARLMAGARRAVEEGTFAAYAEETSACLASPLLVI
jgi:queuine tRNA-ribosyltransferase